MKRNGKRGFTIVELVVVIAVVAILAAVLIPTFASVIKKANVNNDVVLVKELNDGLKIEEVGGKKNDTMTDALNVAKAYGFEVEKLTPRSSGEILWDSVNNRFALLDENGNAVYKDESKTLSSGANLWKIVNNATEAADNTEYSSYIKGNATIATLTVTNGVDVGENIVNELTYENTTGTAKTVTIRTNSYNTVLTINAPLDTVNHYDKAYKVDIIKCDMHSYNEYGSIATSINLAEGHVHLESGSSVSNVIVKELSYGDTTVTPTSGSHKVTVEKDVTITNIYSTVSGVTPSVEGEGKDPKVVLNKIPNYNHTAILNGWATTSDLGDMPLDMKGKRGEKNTVTLLKDQSIYVGSADGKYIFRDGYDVTIDLNGFTLNVPGSIRIGADDYTNNYGVTGIGNVTIKNGTIKCSGSAATVALLQVNANSTLTLENVTIETTGSGVFSNQKASSVTIKNTVIKTGGYGIATNAGEGASEDVTISVESTKIESGAAGICLNVSGMLNVKDSYIMGDEQGVMVRAGNAVISDSEIYAKYFNKVGNITDYSNTKRSANAWEDGNKVMCGAVVVGDYCSGSYPTAANCTLNNVTITAADGWKRGVIVLSSDSDAATFFSYDDKCTVNGKKIDGRSSNLTSNKTNELYVHDAEIEGVTKGSISVNGSVVRQPENQSAN